MTIVIYNNSKNFNIYPVLFAGTESDTDQWMQACFKVPANQISPQDNFPYPRASQYRMDINCCATNENGIKENDIKPGESVTIKLPFYSPTGCSIRRNRLPPTNPLPGRACRCPTSRRSRSCRSRT